MHWLGLLDSLLPTPKLFSCITPWIKMFFEKKQCTIYIRLRKYNSEKIGIFNMKLTLSKSLRLLQHITFIFIVFASYSRNKLINLILLQYNVMCTIHQLLTKAQYVAYTNIQGNFKFPRYITTENALVRNDIYQKPYYFFFFTVTFFISNTILFSIIFAKSFAFKRVMCFWNSI